VTLFLVGAAAERPAWAQGAAARAQANARPAPAPPPTRFEFDNDMVEGELLRPSEEMIRARNVAKHRSLIKVRTDFIPELIQSADRL
jgi:hypothetical protein